MPELPTHVKMLIAGEWMSGQQVIEVRNPANPDEIVGTAVRGAAPDAEHATALRKAPSRERGSTRGKTVAY
jgi:delta 1-pyrroline-5-carboxylate dehydrogenase